MSRFRHITCLAIAGGAASFSMLASASHSRAEDIPPIGSTCEKSTPPHCDGKKAIAVCICGKWSTDKDLLCDEHGNLLLTVYYGPNIGYENHPVNVSDISDPLHCKPSASSSGWGSGSGVVPGFVGIAKSGFREKTGVPALRNAFITERI